MSVPRRRFERVRIFGAQSIEDDHWEMDLGRVNVNAPCVELFGVVFQGHNYVCLVARGGGGDPDFELPLTRDTNLLSVLEMHSLHGDVTVRARNDYRRVRIYGSADDNGTDDKYWQREESVCVHDPVGELFKPVFDAYNHVYVKYRVPFGVLEYTLAKQTTLKTVIDQLGQHQGVIEVYAKNVLAD